MEYLIDEIWQIFYQILKPEMLRNELAKKDLQQDLELKGYNGN